MRSLRKHMLMAAASLLLAAGLTACDTSSEAETETAAETEAVLQTSIYTIVREDNGNKEETDGAVRLRNTLRDEYGIHVELVTDWVNRGENVEDHRYPNEILFGDTNRTESEEACAALQDGTRDMMDYIVTSNENHYVLAATAGNVDAAVTELLAILTEDLTRLNSAPVEVDIQKKHEFPLDDITIGGISVEDYDAIYYDTSYSESMIAEVKALSELIFDACGSSLPASRMPKEITGRNILVGARLDSEVQSGGDFSYGVIPSADSLLLEGQDCWNDWAALDVFMTAIREGIASGKTVTLDEPVRRITDPADDNPYANLQVAAWTIGATGMTTEEQIAGIKECGFNQVILINPGSTEFHNIAKWMAKYELRGLWHQGSMYLEGWQANGNQFPEIPAYISQSISWGHMLRDEPNTTMYEDLNAMHDTLLEAVPEKIPYVNLFPIYANSDQMQAETYEEYVDQFFEVVEPVYASVDIYPLNVGNQIIDNYFVNLEIFSAACRERNVPFGVYIQSVSFAASKRTPDEAEMRWQAYNALAFGATNIEYFTYRTPDSSTETFLNALIARDETKTEAWYGAQKINAALNTMGDAFMQYRHLGTWGVNMQNAPDYFYFDNQYTDFDIIENVEVKADKTLLMGGFTAKEGDGKAFICVNAADPGVPRQSSLEVTVDLASGETVTLYQKDTVTVLTPDADGKISYTLEPGEGVFVTVE